MAVLSQPQSRQEDVRPLQNKWQVTQKKDKTKKTHETTKRCLEEFKCKVIAAARESQQQLANSAEQPDTPVTVEQSAIDSGSADQPAWKISSFHDVNRWLASDHVASCSMVERIKEAVAVLSQPHPRKEDVQALQSKWQVHKRRVGNRDH